MIKQLTETEKPTLFALYRRDSLFKHWFSILSLNSVHIKLDPVSLWLASEKVIGILRDDDYERAEMVEYIIDDLLSKHNRNQVAAVMCVVLTRLANATEKGHEQEDHPNDSICVAIYRYFINDQLFVGLLAKFRGKQTDNYGRKVVIEPSDPLANEGLSCDTDEVLMLEMDKMIILILEKTSTLKPLYKDNWERWELLWRRLCSDAVILKTLKEVSPRRNDWEINQKMVCNVIGVFLSKLKLDIPVQKINTMLSTKKLSSYISNYSPGNGSDTSLTKELYATDIIDKI